MSIRGKIETKRLTETLSAVTTKRIKSSKLTFADQAERFLTEGATRKRDPLRPSSVRTYRSAIDRLNLMIGKVLLQDVGNKVVKEVVQKLSEEGYSARTITLNIVVIKKIRKSAITDNGDQMFPYEWNTDVIDAPSISHQGKAVVSVQELQDAISKAGTDRKALYALLAGTGLRINEARGIKIGPDDGVSTIWIPRDRKIIVRQQMGRDGLAPVKTEAGVREVDLTVELNNTLSEVFIDWFTGTHPPNDLLFPDCENCYRDSLEEDGIIGGFHTLRRFRITHLRMSGVPDPLVKFWVGHAAGNVTEQYTQVAGEIESRKLWAEKAGLGFKL
jgi:integrase